MNDRTRTVGDHADLLIELGCEELPPKALDSIRDAFFNGVRDGLEKAGIAFQADASRAYSTPRRLALHFVQTAPQQPDQDQKRRGPAVGAAFDDEGRPTQAALGFARSVGKDVSELDRLKTEKGEWLFARVHQPGQALGDLIYPILEQSLRQLPVPKPMRWASHEFSFVRPVHWLVVLHGDRVLEGRLFGLDAGDSTRGHRIHSPGPHAIGRSESYLDVLEAGCVLADPERRRQRIREQVLAAEPDALVDSDLLDEVNNLVEWPVAVPCTFESSFLEIPHAALIASMQDHQKFFPVRDKAAASGGVSNRFVAVSNIESLDVAAVQSGYERVIRPRLADARFFFEQDQLQPLAAYLDRLNRVVFQRKIGTIGDKSKRMASIAGSLAEEIEEDISTAERAALLSKCDLMTHMVGEFPELQGEMGMHYALASGEPPGVAQAIGEHYAPRFAGDDIPTTAAGQLVSIADRSDSLVGIFAAGLRPSGNKDPFALRRSALGLIRILTEAELEVELNRVLAVAALNLGEQLEISPDVLSEVRSFVVERLNNYYRDQGFGSELVNAAVASPWTTLPDLRRRLRALDGFMGEEAAQSLAAANKRIGNILRKAEIEITDHIEADKLVLDEERAIFEEVISLENELSPLIERGSYDEGLQRLARLKAPVDRFFDTVMVMDEDLDLRRNRLALLTRVKALFDRIADLSILG